MGKPRSNVVPFSRKWQHRGHEPSLKAIQLAVDESIRLGEPINADTARQLLIELSLSGSDGSQWDD